MQEEKFEDLEYLRESCQTLLSLLGIQHATETAGDAWVVITKVRYWYNHQCQTLDEIPRNIFVECCKPSRTCNTMQAVRDIPNGPLRDSVHRSLTKSLLLIQDLKKLGTDSEIRNWFDSLTFLLDAALASLTLPLPLRGLPGPIPGLSGPSVSDQDESMGMWRVVHSGDSTCD